MSFVGGDFLGMIFWCRLIGFWMRVLDVFREVGCSGTSFWGVLLCVVRFFDGF